MREGNTFLNVITFDGVNKNKNERGKKYIFVIKYYFVMQLHIRL